MMAMALALVHAAAAAEPPSQHQSYSPLGLPLPTANQQAYMGWELEVRSPPHPNPTCWSLLPAAGSSRARPRTCDPPRACPQMFVHFSITTYTGAPRSVLSHRAVLSALPPPPPPFRGERAQAFVVYSLTSITGSQSGTQDPALFAPPANISVKQWVSTVKAMGAPVAALTAKHEAGTFSSKTPRQNPRAATRTAVFVARPVLPDRAAWLCIRQGSASGRRSSATTPSRTALPSDTATS